MKRIWSGGASDTGGPDLSTLMTEEDNETDSHLINYEILGLLAYHLELSEKRVIPFEETKDILESLLKLYSAGLTMSNEFEDVHSLIDENVKAQTDAGKNLRVFLSRNDQSHYDIRSFYLDRLLKMASLLLDTSMVVKQGLCSSKGYMAGYTHYRQAMPVAVSTYFDHVCATLNDLSLDSISMPENNIFSALSMSIILTV